MADTFPPKQQRPALLALAEIIQSQAGALRRDDCNDYAIHGGRGHIYADGPESFVFVAKTQHGASWNKIKARLFFCRLTQDGDHDGVLILDRMPTAAEGAAIREALRIAKRWHLTEEQRARRVAALRLARENLDLNALSRVKDGDFDVGRYDHSRQPSEAEKTASELVPA